MTYNITVDIKNVYGNELIYPVCFNAKKFTSLTKNKTLSKKDIDIIKTLGYKIIIKPQKITLTNGWVMTVRS